MFTLLYKLEILKLIANHNIGVLSLLTSLQKLAIFILSLTFEEYS